MNYLAQLAEDLSLPGSKAFINEQTAINKASGLPADTARIFAVKSFATRFCHIPEEAMAPVDEWQDRFTWRKIAQCKNPVKIAAHLEGLVY